MLSLRLYRNKFYFTPKLLPTLVTLVLLPLLISLGFWQLHRAEIKKALLVEYQARSMAPPLALSALSSDINRFKYAIVEFNGYYDNSHSILLDNKISNHQVGYEVLTPFIPQQDSRMILVNRGWIPSGNDRQHLPKIIPITGQQMVRGLIYIPQQKPFILGQSVENTNWPLVSQTVAITQFAQRLQRPCYPFIVLLAANIPGGFVREWNPITVSPYKNIGYAVQWFALALVLLIIFIVVNMQREKP